MFQTVPLVVDAEVEDSPCGDQEMRNNFAEMDPIEARIWVTGARECTGKIPILNVQWSWSRLHSLDRGQMRDNLSRILNFLIILFLP